MKLLLEPIQVHSVQGEPRRLDWRGRTWPVEEILDHWIWRGRWWMDADLTGQTRHYFRLRSRGATLEIYASGEDWVLSRVWD